MDFGFWIEVIQNLNPNEKYTRKRADHRAGARYVTTSGDWEQRPAQAIEAIDSLFWILDFGLLSIQNTKSKIQNESTLDNVLTTGDVAALYDAHAPRLYALALRITSDRDAATAAIEEAFLRVCESADEPAESTFRTLVRLTRERALAHRQGQSDSSDVRSDRATPAGLVEELFFGGLSLRDLAGRYGLGESQVRRMIHDGMAALRTQVAQQE